MVFGAHIFHKIFNQINMMICSGQWTVVVVGVNTGCLTKTSFSYFVVGHHISGAIQNATQTSWYKSLVYLKLFWLSKKIAIPVVLGMPCQKVFFLIRMCYQQTRLGENSWSQCHFKASFFSGHTLILVVFLVQNNFKYHTDFDQII